MYYLVGILFEDWIKYLNTIPNIIPLMINNDLENITSDDFIIPMSIDGYIKYHNHPNLLFNFNIDIVKKMDNKALFTFFMMNTENFKTYLPKIFYIHDEQYKIFYYNKKKNNNDKLILRSNNGFGSYGVKIINNFFFLHTKTAPKNCVISKYIHNTEHYVGHFLVINGVIIKKVYYKSKNNTFLFIKRGSIVNYTRQYDLLDFNDAIFYNIYKKLNYSGFACIDFIVVKNNPIIFELDPRIGGSLIHNIEDLHSFFNVLFLYKKN